MCLSGKSQVAGPPERNNSFQRRPNCRDCLKIRQRARCRRGRAAGAAGFRLGHSGPRWDRKKPTAIPWIRGPDGLGYSGHATHHDRLFLIRNLLILSNYLGNFLGSGSACIIGDTTGPILLWSTSFALDDRARSESSGPHRCRLLISHWGRRHMQQGSGADDRLGLDNGDGVQHRSKQVREPDEDQSMEFSAGTSPLSNPLPLAECP